MKNYLKYAGLVIVVFLLGFGAARYTTPLKTVTVVKEVVKVKKDIVTTTRRVKLPDGTITTETRKEDRSTTDKNKELTQIVENEKAQWRASLLYAANGSYGGAVERRILGPVFAGVYVLDKTAAVGVSFEW